MTTTDATSGRPPLLRVRDFSVAAESKQGEPLPVLRNIDLTLRAGEVLGLTGESGSGKSTLALALMGYLKPGLQICSGDVELVGRQLFDLSRDELARVRGGQVAWIPQNPGQALTPSQTIGTQIIESLELHASAAGQSHRQRALALLTRVRLPHPQTLIDYYPHQLSAGQQHGVVLAMALAGEPQLLLLDEPVTGMDVTTQAHILKLLRTLAVDTGIAMLCISHNPAVVARCCERLAVMYSGEIILSGSTGQVLRTPCHPYARQLFAMVPTLTRSQLSSALHGTAPAPAGRADGCAFGARCPIVEAACLSQRPALRAVDQQLFARCLLPYGELPSAAANEPPVAVADRSTPPVLTVKNVSVSYAVPGLIDIILRRRSARPLALEAVCFQLRKAQTLALIGESGAGKSTLLRSIAGVLPWCDGEMNWHGDSPLPAVLKRRRPVQLRRIQSVFQNPDEILDPAHTVAENLAQPLKQYFSLAGRALHQRTQQLLVSIRLAPEYLDYYPGQLSGGERQRLAIACAFAPKPDLLLCDNMTSALDVSLQAAVLGWFNELRRERGTSMVFASHDLALVYQLADRVVVLQHGRVCESGATREVFSQPSHPHTRQLLEAARHCDFGAEAAAR